MDPLQAKTLKEILTLSKQYQKIYPEVAEMYRSGKTLDKIAEQTLPPNGSDGYSLKTVVWYMINGHKGGLEVDPFEGLIPDENERKTLGKKHMGSSKTSNKGVRARGLVPWGSTGTQKTGMREPDYLTYIVGLRLPEYTHQIGGNKGEPKWGALEKVFNAIYHGREKVRSKDSIRTKHRTLTK